MDNFNKYKNERNRFIKSLEHTSELLNENNIKNDFNPVILEKTEAGPGKIFKYNYILRTLALHDIDLREFIPSIRDSLAESLKKNHAMNIFKKKRVTLVYTYYDKNHELIHSFKFLPSDYI